MVKAVLDYLISNNIMDNNMVRAVFLFLLSKNGIVNNVVKTYVKFNTNSLQNTFIC